MLCQKMAEATRWQDRASSLSLCKKAGSNQFWWGRSNHSLAPVTELSLGVNSKGRGPWGSYQTQRDHPRIDSRFTKCSVHDDSSVTHEFWSLLKSTSLLLGWHGQSIPQFFLNEFAHGSSVQMPNHVTYTDTKARGAAALVLGLQWSGQ